MADIASLYYVDGLSQSKIASRVGISRSAVSYLLQEAREQDIVTFRINRPLIRVNHLERALREQFGLPDVRVVASDPANEESTLDRIGQCVELLLDAHLKNGMVLGISPGTGVSAATQALRPRRLPDVKIVQLTGGLGAPHRLLDATEQCALAAGIFGAQPYYLHAPLVVDSPDVAAALRRDPTIACALDLAAHADIALMGIGAVVPQASTQFHAGYLSYEDLLRLDKIGVVGGLCTSFFDIQGQYVAIPWLDARMMGITWGEMCQIGLTIGIAAGKQKARAVLGAARSHRLHTLVIDDVAAELVLYLNQQEI